MKLYWFQVAPNPTRVRLSLEEKKAAGSKIKVEEIVIKIVKGEGKNQEFLDKNPFGTVPVLELDDGTKIIESLAIIEYLEMLYPETPMWGDTILEKTRARELERIVELKVLMPVANYIHATNSPLGLPSNPTVAAHAINSLPSGLDYVQNTLDDGRDYLCGNTVTVADFTLQAATQFARFASVDLKLTNYPKIKTWDDRFRQRKSAKNVLVV